MQICGLVRYTAPCDFGGHSALQGTFCSYTQLPEAAVSWTLKNGRTLTPNTGPSSGQGGSGTLSVVKTLSHHSTCFEQVGMLTWSATATTAVLN